MNRSGQAFGWVAALLVAGGFTISTLRAGTPTNNDTADRTSSGMTSPNPVPSAKSPVTLFRELLARAPAARENYLSRRPPEVRRRILDKVLEYEALDPDTRELRLRATELHWYLSPLMRESRKSRAAQLAAIPDDMRELVEARLGEWDILPPQLQQEFLNNEQALRYFDNVDPPEASAEHGAAAARWNALSDNERQRFAAKVNQFFNLSPEEKQKALNTLSDAERQQMVETLQSFEKLTPVQRAECVRAFSEFAGMTALAKQEFLSNAERWSQLSPTERQAWRDLVAHVPEWPPLPPGLVLTPPPPNGPPAMATNH